MSKTSVIGVLSGTSMDGVSLGLFEFSKDNSQVQTQAFDTYPLPSEYKPTLRKLIQENSCDLNTFGQLDHWVGELFAQAVVNFIKVKQLDIESIDAVASHGQTIWHAPSIKRPFTLQIGDPNIIAARTGITTIADFRRADMANGGQGAPLAPAFHLQVFGSATQPRCIVNVGGFSNVSILEKDRYLGFDTGPGNYLMDYWVKKHFHMDFDVDGKLAASGTVHESLLNHCLADPYFSKPPPKSTGHEYFNEQWLDAKIAQTGQEIKPIDVLTTVLHLTATSIAMGIKNHAHPTMQVFLCGGGAHNNELTKQLGLLLEQNVNTTLDLGIHPDCVESALFAWLGFMRLNNQRIDLRSITGSTKPVILGGIFAS